MKIDQLIYFVETARQEHIGKAARILAISPSAISHSIAALEGELGYELFEKKGKNIVLTDEGRRLKDLSQDLISQFQNLRENLLNTTSEKAHFRMAGSHMLSHLYLTRAWASLTDTYKQTTVDLLSLRSADVIKGVLSREFDLGLCFSPQGNAELESKTIYEGELLIAVRKNHPVLRLPVGERLRALSAYPAVLPKAFQGVDVCITHPMFDQHKVSVLPQTLFDNYDVSLEMIKATDYWGLVPDLFVSPGMVALKPAKGWRAPFSISLIYLKKRFVPNFFADLREALLKLFK